MAWVNSFGLSFLLCSVGYSTLIHFYEQEKGELMLRELVLPKPRKGKFVSYLAVTVGVFSALPMLIAPFDTRHIGVSGLVFLSIFFLYPTLGYGAHLYAGLHRPEGKLVFSPTRASQNYSWKIPIAGAAAINLVAWVAMGR